MTARDGWVQDCSTSMKMAQFGVEKYDGWMNGRIGITLCAVKITCETCNMSKITMIASVSSYLADRTNGRAIGTLLRLSSVCL